MLQPPNLPRPAASRTALAWVLGTSAFFGLAHATLHLWYPARHALPDAIRLLFDVTSEASLATWVSVCTQLLLGLACLLVAARERSRAWAATGALFLFLSADDEAQIHERMSWLVSDPDGTAGVYAWVISFAPAYALAGALAFLHVLRATPRSERATVLASGACLCAALLVEACEGPLKESARTWRGLPAGDYTVALEEALELAGPGLLLVVVGARLRIAELWRAVASPAAAQPADVRATRSAALDAGHATGSPPRRSDAA